MYLKKYIKYLSTIKNYIYKKQMEKSLNIGFIKANFASFGNKNLACFKTNKYFK